MIYTKADHILAQLLAIASLRFSKPDKQPKYPPHVQAARDALRIKGWNQVQAAKLLDVSYVHLNYVVTNMRTSAILLKRIHELPTNPNPN